jgi:hypothetical protein
MNDPNTGAAHNIVNAYGAAELQTRVSNHEQEVDNATASYQNNYRYYSQDHTFVSPTANGTVGDLIAVAIPMGQRYRLRIISTFAQLLISYDGE